MSQQDDVLETTVVLEVEVADASADGDKAEEESGDANGKSSGNLSDTAGNSTA